MKAALALAALLAACRGGETAAGAPKNEARVDGAAPPEASAATLPEPIAPDLWASAAEGDVADLARLHDREGDPGLLARVASPPFRMTAILALAYGDDFTALPFLAGVAVSGDDEEARVALASAGILAALPRRARDPEDALELRQGCEGLLVLARSAEAARSRRAAAVSTLRMLADTGCLHGEALPTDLDAR